MFHSIYAVLTSLVAGEVGREVVDIDQDAGLVLSIFSCQSQALVCDEGRRTPV